MDPSIDPLWFRHSPAHLC